MRRELLDNKIGRFTLLAMVHVYEPLPPGEGGVSPAARGNAPFERFTYPQIHRNIHKIEVLLCLIGGYG